MQFHLNIIVIKIQLLSVRNQIKRDKKELDFYITVTDNLGINIR